MRKFLIAILFASISLILFSQNKVVLSVMDFDYSGISKEDMKGIIARLSSEIFKTGLYEVIDINQRETLLAEMQFALSGLADEANMIKIGQFLSAEVIITGSLRVIKNRVHLSCKLIQVETGKTLDTVDGIYASLEAILKTAPDLARRIIDLNVDRPFLVLEAAVAASGSLPVLDMQAILAAGVGANLALFGSLAPLPSIYFGLESGYSYFLGNNPSCSWFMEIPLVLVMKYKLTFTPQFSLAPVMGGGAIAAIISVDADGILPGEEPVYSTLFAIEPLLFCGLDINLGISKKLDLTLAWQYNFVLEQAQLLQYMTINPGLIIHL